MWSATFTYVTMQILIPYLHKRKSTTFFHRFCSICKGSWYVLCFVLYTHEICHICVQNIRHITNEFLSLYFKKLRRVAELVEFWKLFSVTWVRTVCLCVTSVSKPQSISAAAGPHNTNVSTRSIHTPHCRYLERSPPASRHCASCCASLRDARRHMSWCPRCHFDSVRKCVVYWFMHQLRGYVVTVSESFGSGSVILTDFRSVQRRTWAFPSFGILKEW